jgi:hypothetical protein
MLVCAQPQKEIRVRASYDSSAVPELFNTIPVGFTFSYPDGSSSSTRGWLHGHMRWNSLQITTPQGVLHNGQLTFDREKVWRNNHEITFYIRVNDTSLVCALPLPYIQKIRFNLYTDSLKRNNPFYLNVEGRFSNGRTYPLDTNMVIFSKSGGGILRGNILSVTTEDTATHAVSIHACLKTDTMMQDHITVPVKIAPDTARLPTEQDLLRRWDRGRRRH